MFLEEIAIRPISKSIDSELENALKKVNFSKIPLDVQIQIEAYKNQAIIGDNPNPRPERYSMVLETLLHDAWARLRGTSQSLAKRELLKIIRNYQG